MSSIESILSVGLCRTVALKSKKRPAYSNLKNIPLAPFFLETQIPIVVGDNVDLTKWGNQTLDLAKPSNAHQRASTFFLQDHETHRGEPMLIEMADTHGNFYRELNVKGNDFSFPHGLIRPSNGDVTYDVWGMHRLDLLDRSARTSELFRKHGIDTEWIFYAAKPKEFYTPTSSEPVSISQLRNYATRNILNFGVDPARVDAEKGLNDAEFVVLLRAFKSSHRLNDLEGKTTESKRSLIVEHIKIHNRDCEIKARHSPEPLPYGPISEDDVATYILDVLPKRIGRNIAKMHNLRVQHRFLYSNNVSLAGEVVDLDSPVGKLIEESDAEPTYIDLLGELERLTSTDDGWFTDLSDILPRDVPNREHWDIFKKNLRDTYLSTRTLKPDSFEAVSFSLLDFSTERMRQTGNDGEIVAFMNHFFDENHEMLFSPTVMENIVDIKMLQTKLGNKRHGDVIIETLKSYMEIGLIFTLEKHLEETLRANLGWIRNKMKRESIPEDEEINIIAMLISLINMRYVELVQDAVSEAAPNHVFDKRESKKFWVKKAKKNNMDAGYANNMKKACILGILEALGYERPVDKTLIMVT